ncbi:MAG: hypothetical protein JXR42_05145 [Gammaproteobacteria bacterium]|nr:hypothetical protein [Gammaproteobacteria bacterium]
MTIELGENHPDISFTKREAECMWYFLKGQTMRAVASIFNLSPRTVEFYANNMKKKLSCKTKSELIDQVLKSDFRANAKAILGLE